jgi:hypothetical protein
MLTFNPNKRYSVEECLNHKYLKSLHNAKTEYECRKPFDFGFEKVELTRDKIKEFMWDEVLQFRPNCKDKRDKWMQLVCVFVFVFSFSVVAVVLIVLSSLLAAKGKINQLVAEQGRT